MSDSQRIFFVVASSSFLLAFAFAFVLSFESLLLCLFFSLSPQRDNPELTHTNTRKAHTTKREAQPTRAQRTDKARTKHTPLLWVCLSSAHLCWRGVREWKGRDRHAGLRRGPRDGQDSTVERGAHKRECMPWWVSLWFSLWWFQAAALAVLCFCSCFCFLLRSVFVLSCLFVLCLRALAAACVACSSCLAFACSVCVLVLGGLWFVCLRVCACVLVVATSLLSVRACACACGLCCQREACGEFRPTLLGNCYIHVSNCSAWRRCRRDRPSGGGVAAQVAHMATRRARKCAFDECTRKHPRPCFFSGCARCCSCPASPALQCRFTAKKGSTRFPSMTMSFSPS